MTYLVALYLLAFAVLLARLCVYSLRLGRIERTIGELERRPGSDERASTTR